MLLQLVLLLRQFASVHSQGAVEWLGCEASSCSECVQQGCGWAPGIDRCAKSCHYMPDIPCYSEANQGGLSETEICELVDTHASDQQRCAAAETCQNCQSTLKADGSACQWYETTSSCGRGVCGLLGCGSSVCPTLRANDEVLSCQADSCQTCLALFQDDGTTPCRWDSNSRTCRAGECNFGDICSTCDATGPCDYGTCSECLDNGCGYADEVCTLSCDLLVDTTCADSGSIPGLTNLEICAVVASNRADAALCLEQSNCATCSNTVLSDDSSNCAWTVIPSSGEESCCQWKDCNPNAVPLTDCVDPEAIGDSEDVGQSEGVGRIVWEAALILIAGLII